MSKERWAIMAALIGLSASKDWAKKRNGSRGLKRNKLFEQFSSEQDKLISDLKSQVMPWDEDDIKTIEQCIEDRGCEDPSNSPESIAYASFYFGFMMKTSNAWLLDEESGGWDLIFKMTKTAKDIHDSIAQISNACGYDTETIQSLKELKSLAELEWSYNWFNRPRHLRGDIFEYSIRGLILSRASRCIVSISSDKNLAEMYSKALISNPQMVSSEGIYLSRGLSMMSVPKYGEEIIRRKWEKIKNNPYYTSKFSTKPDGNNLRFSGERLLNTILDTETDAICSSVLEDLGDAVQYSYIDISDDWESMGSIGESLIDDGYQELGQEIMEELDMSSEYRFLCEYAVHGLRLDNYGGILSRFYTEYIESGGPLTHAVDLWVREFENMVENRKAGSQINSNSFRIGVNSISLSQRDRAIAVLPMEDIVRQQGDDSEIGISRVILVEYKDRRTLVEIYNNTPGSLCVGSPHQNYMARLENGTQRHFGILAQTTEGALHVMYHTHSERGVLNNFTDAITNSAKPIESWPDHHQPTLRAAREAIRGIL